MNITIGNEPWRTLLSGADPEYQEQAARERLSHLPEYAAEAGFTADEQEQLAKETAQLSASPDLLELWDRMTRIINTTPGGFEAACTEPQFESGGVRPFPLYLMIVLAGVPYMKALYKEHGWYETAWGEALLDIRIWMDYRPAAWPRDPAGTAPVQYARKFLQLRPCLPERTAEHALRADKPGTAIRPRRHVGARRGVHRIPHRNDLRR